MTDPYSPRTPDPYGAHTAAPHTTAAANQAHGQQPPATGQPPAGEQRSVGELLSNVSEDLSLLVRQELALAKAEATQTASRVGKGSGMLAGAAIGGYFVLLFLSIALWWSLGEAIGHGWSALVVTVIWAIIAAALAVLGRTALRKARGLPQTTDTVKNIPGALTPHPQEKS
ncbi:phage holin family protein [Williamsia muralis]|uniref:phage holin family protein n=1 Tax=Williamsia marianensis TaxID=85044 RepID=UPI000DE6C262|nr:phage holin family protein [Williamsia marianensis]PVY26901.1 putative superfamily III holin-X [Williamsia marianensis]